MENNNEAGNKVSVKIYGQEYVIAGEKSRDHIMRVADYVDRKMHEVSKAMSAPVSSLAVLSAVNAADDYFSLIEELGELRQNNTRLEKDTQHYIQLWEEAKKNFMQNKEDSQSLLQQKEELQRLLAEKSKHAEELMQRVRELEKQTAQVAEATEDALQERIKEMENNCFDLEMENIKLKSELERLKR